MCGIYGQWDRSGRPVDLPAVQYATTLLRHRGRDDEGYLLADSRSGRTWPAAGPDTIREMCIPPIATAAGGPVDLALGFRRLAIIDRSSLGHQPMPSPDGRYWIVFNGEIFNYQELRYELAALGHECRGGSDTSVILAAYSVWGEECLDRFNGMWAFAIWDTHERSLFMARDRFGVKPLFYAEIGTRFAFASEAKALVGPQGVPFAPDEGTLHAYLLTGMLPGGQTGNTFFSHVRQLPPGHCLRITANLLEQRRYYRLPEWTAEEEVDTDSLLTEYGRLFTDAVRLRMNSDVPVGTCLSGGLDSSAVACTISALMAEGGPEARSLGPRQKTFSAVYGRPGERYDETRYIDIAVAATGADPTFIIPTAERLHEEVERMVWHQDEPVGSTSIFAQWRVMAAAREQGVVVLLDGQGADEALGGYRPFDVLLAQLLRRGRIGRAVRLHRDVVAVDAAVSGVSLLARALVRQLPDSQLEWLRSRRDSGSAAAFRSSFESGPRVVRPVADASRNLHAHYREQILDTSLPHLLRYEDRNSMAFGVEGRVPFLDHRLVEFSLVHLHRLTLYRGWTKWALRQAMRGRVPEEILWRRDKVGFETPEAEWGHALMVQRKGMFDDGALLGSYMDLAAIRTAAMTESKEPGGPRRLWRWINAELWLRAFS